MITGEIKNQIDRIWDVFWTSGMTNPMTVLEQMTYLFFIKMLDDKQRQEEANAAVWGNRLMNPVFKEGEWHNEETEKSVPYNGMRWSVFKNTGSDNMFRMVRDNVFPFIKTIGAADSNAYSRFMKDAAFMIPNPRTLQRLVDGIDSLDMNNRDAMGDVYEYILGKMAASGTNGQFRTPRHIIAMMVSLMQPTVDDAVCDPAMGSAGFIVEAAKYVGDKYKKELMDPAKLKHYRSEMFFGFDTDQTMLRIGAMNMMLHGVDAPNIAWRDSLSNDNTDANLYTLCLANPPFAGSLDRETIAKSLLQVANTTKTELLFMALFLRSLKLGGRCASIVPDGVLFGNSNAHKAIRKELVDNQRLQAVISMPSGVFQPYAGVSTAILIFTKTNTPNSTDRVWFYEMHADGFTLDQKRTPCAKNDIPDVISRFHNLDAETNRSRKDQSFFVPVEEIRANDYDLTFNKYKEVERKVVEYDAPEMILAHIDDLQSQIAEGLTNLKSIINH
jgi:type I restriction enzyme M protein